jgi:hypothetical protein
MTDAMTDLIQRLKKTTYINNKLEKTKTVRDAIALLTSQAETEARLREELEDARNAYGTVVEALREELEVERMRLAACSTAALGNTPEAATQRIAPSHRYYSASYADVCQIVDAEMRLREELAHSRLEHKETVKWSLRLSEELAQVK